MRLSQTLTFRRVNRLTRPFTTGVRVLPDYIVIGAQKAASSSLYRHLRTHPANVRAEIKECHFFDSPDYHLGETFYRRRFPTRLHMGLGRYRYGGAKTGEATPTYLFHPLAAARMHAIVPKARLIAVLREPVARCISQYAMAKHNGVEAYPFAEAIRREQARLAPGWERASRGEEPGLVFTRQSYASRGCYAEQLSRYLAHFDREQLLVIDSRELRKSPQEVLDRCVEHIGLPPLPQWAIDDYDVNVGKKKPTVTDADRAFLRAYFEEPNQRLFDEWGIDFRA